MSLLKKSLAFLSLIFLAGVSDGQKSNITLSLFEISPCNSPYPQSVSRFKSDIYVVKADLSNCTLNATSQAGVKFVSAAAKL